MREDEFRAWLAEGSINPKAGQARTYAVRTIEKNLAGLGSRHSDLDTAWQADRFVDLRQRLKDLQSDFSSGGERFRTLMPLSAKPLNRLNTWRNALGQYGKFLSGEPRKGSLSDAVLQTFVDRLSRAEIDSAIAECGEEGTEAFLADRSFAVPRRWITQDGIDARYPAKAIVAAAISYLSDGPDLTAHSFFNGFGEDRAFTRLEALGYTVSAATTVQPFTLDATPVWIVAARWGEDDGLQRFVDRGEWSLTTDTDGPNNRRVREMQPGDRIVLRDYFHQTQSLPFDAKGARVSAIRIRARGTVTQQHANGLSVGVDWDKPLEYPRIWYFYTQNDPVWRLKDPGQAPLADRLRSFLLHGIEQDYEYFLNQWFAADNSIELQGDSPIPSPTNLILYGPPGTGKTYTTASEAVAVCDGPDAKERYAADRPGLMERYRELEQEGRIRLVTFHQNVSYEEFVEGLRPVVGEGEQTGAGFALEDKPGIFREICAIAEQARKHPAASTASEGAAFTGRAFWKMSVGSSRTEDDVYEAALSGGYVALGWGGDEDWSDPAYASENAIRERWQSAPRTSTEPSNWAQTHRLRNVMKQGDLVIVPYGNSAFRGIAEVTGEYWHDAAAEGYFAQRRKVKWLVNLEEPLPLDTIVDGNFTMRTLYSVPSNRIKMPALERLISSDQETQVLAVRQSAPDQFVLIIDEINRANISKVFGELITLLEPDKRLGMANALTVRLPYSRKEFGVPANLHVIGTMNTADRSIALLDTALRRRFVFREMVPQPDLLPSPERVPLPAVLTAINERIEYLVDREHRIGHAFFIHCDTRADVDAVMRDKVIPLLQEYFFEDWSRIAAVVGPGFVEGRKLMAPPGMKDLGPRETWSVRAIFAPDAYTRLVGGAEAIVPENDAPHDYRVDFGDAPA